MIRFDGAERFVHWTHAALFLLLVATGALMIWSPPARAIAIGPYRVVPLVHSIVGVAFLLAPFLPWLRRRGASLAADLRGWLRWRPAQPKFNVGQRLNALWTIFSMFWLGVTGLIIWLGRAVPYWIQEPAYEWHVFLALIAFLVFLGHLVMAFTHPSALRAILTGRTAPPT